MADATTLARPYAKAVFEVARSADALGAWADALAVASAGASSEAVLQMIADPNVDNDTLLPIFAAAGDAPEGYDNFLNLLNHNDRLPVLPEIARLYEQLRAEAERTLNVMVRSATELSEEYRRRLSDSLAKKYDKKIALEAVVDPNMIGGAIIQAGDMVIDGSLRRKLNLLSESLKP
ncbi:MAG: F0F1 ATP synthase subunit delta [Pseudomonadota bacterium]